jgi:hypothetical protein
MKKPYYRQSERRDHRGRRNTLTRKEIRDEQIEKTVLLVGALYFAWLFFGPRASPPPPSSMPAWPIDEFDYGAR